MSTYQRKEDRSKLLHRAFYLVGMEADLEAIQFSYFLGVIKTLTVQLLSNKHKMPEVDV